MKIDRINKMGSSEGSGRMARTEILKRQNKNYYESSKVKSCLRPGNIQDVWKLYKLELHAVWSMLTFSGGNLDFPKIKKSQHSLFQCLWPFTKLPNCYFWRKIILKTVNCVWNGLFLLFHLEGKSRFSRLHPKSFITSITGLWRRSEDLDIPHCMSSPIKILQKQLELIDWKGLLKN